MLSSDNGAKSSNLITGLGMFKTTFRPDYRNAPPQKMDGYSINCFDCKKNCLHKSELRRDHSGHDVEFVNAKLERFNG